MTRREMNNILKVPFIERCKKGLPTFDWEDGSKYFVRITNERASELFSTDSILKCNGSKGTYYFGVGVEDCEKMPYKKVKELLTYGVWYLYTCSL